MHNPGTTVWTTPGGLSRRCGPHCALVPPGPWLSTTPGPCPRFIHDAVWKKTPRLTSHFARRPQCPHDLVLLCSLPFLTFPSQPTSQAVLDRRVVPGEVPGRARRSGRGGCVDCTHTAGPAARARSGGIVA